MLINQCWSYISGTTIVARDRKFTVRESFQWLEKFKPAARVANFGCWATQMGKEHDGYMTEPFALLWTLEAIHLDVVEIKKEFVDTARQCLSLLQSRVPECFQQRQINIIHGDMTEFVLPANSYDLAFSAHVIAYTGLLGLQAMTHCVRVSGIVAVIDYESTELAKLVTQIPNLVPVEEVDKSNTIDPNETYAYRKINI